ncbi:hypothetical protein Tco_0282536 [Tanacetum coccineum]
MNVLKCFKEVAGLKINLHKSKIYGVGVERGELDTMAYFIRCSVGEVSFTYLGLPIGVNMQRVSSWNDVIKRIKSSLSEWKAKAMSFWGRLTLVKSVLGSLLLYYFSKFRVLSIVIDALERQRRVRREAGSTKTEWNTLVPRKVNVFILRALNDRIPVRNELDKKGRRQEVELAAGIFGLRDHHKYV